MPRRQVTSGFFRIQMLVVMGLGVLATLSAAMEVRSITDAAHSSELGWLPILMSLSVGLIALLGLLGFVGSVLWTLERRTGAERVGFSVFFFSAALIVVPHFISNVVIHIGDTSVMIIGKPEATSHFTGALTAVSEFAGAAVLGGTVVGMLLGHWYLTTPTMSIGPLSWFARTLAVAAVLRLAMTGIAFGRFGFASHDIVHLLWLVLRLVGGILVPFATSIVVAKILKYRNTQAATGVLFAALILVFMGEMSAALLERDLRIPY